MNLFWETRHLTQAREDHLTCFVAAALEVDQAFRGAYEARVLAPLAVGGILPRIRTVRTQVAFPTHHCRPDLMFVLADGRNVVCEHKIDAPETPETATQEDGVLQLERYLALPDMDAVAYFRSSLAAVAGSVLANDCYLRPATAPHFLWRDLYEPLAQGRHVLSAWLREGFERLGFTPPLAHVGELWPDDTEGVKENQRNFGKLWHRTGSQLQNHWQVLRTGRRCELYLEPNKPAMVSRAYVSPLAQGGSLLRLRVEVEESLLVQVRCRLEAVALALPVVPEVSAGQLPNGRRFCDLLAPLSLVLGFEGEAADHEARLFAQVVPVLQALIIDA